MTLHICDSNGLVSVGEDERIRKTKRGISIIARNIRDEKDERDAHASRAHIYRNKSQDATRVSQLTIRSAFTCHLARPLDSGWTLLVMKWADGTYPELINLVRCFFIQELDWRL